MTVTTTVLIASVVTVFYLLVFIVIRDQPMSALMPRHRPVAI